MPWSLAAGLTMDLKWARFKAKFCEENPFIFTPAFPFSRLGWSAIKIRKWWRCQHLCAQRWMGSVGWDLKTSGIKGKEGIFVFQEFPRPGTRSSMNAVLLLTLISLSQSGNGTKTINGSLKLQRQEICKEKDNQIGKWCFKYRLRRRTLYYLTNLILPCILIASMVTSRGSSFCWNQISRQFLGLLFHQDLGRSCHWVRFRTH